MQSPEGPGGHVMQSVVQVGDYREGCRLWQKQKPFTWPLLLTGMQDQVVRSVFQEKPESQISGQT